jgi:uncharacterized protein YoxC
MKTTNETIGAIVVLIIAIAFMIMIVKVYKNVITQPNWIESVETTNVNYTA